MRTLFAGLLPLLLLVLSPITVLASSGLTIAPATIDLMMQPNRSVIQSLNLTNVGSSETYHVELRRLIPQGNHGGSTISSDSLDPSQIPLTLTFNNLPLNAFTLNLPTNGVATVSLKIDSATTDKNEEYYLALAFVPDIQPTLGTKPIIALPLLVTITPNGNLDLDLEIVDFELPTLVDNTTAFTVSPKVKNNGHHMFRPGGKLTVTSPTNRMDTFEIDPNLTLAATTRVLNFTKSPTLQPLITRFGPYNFTLTLTTPGGKTILENSRIVWFFPIRFTIISIIVLLLALAIFLSRHRLFTHTIHPS